MRGEAQVDRVERLKKKGPGMVSTAEVEVTAAELAIAEARVEEAKAEEALARLESSIRPPGPANAWRPSGSYCEVPGGRAGEALARDPQERLDEFS